MNVAHADSDRTKGKRRSASAGRNESCFSGGMSPAQELTSRAPRCPAGAEVRSEGGTLFRVWAPAHREVAVILEDTTGATLVERHLQPETGGYFSSLVDEASAGMLYRFRLSGSQDRLPDPASRFQPTGPNGPVG